MKVDFLIEKGAQIQAKTKMDETILHLAGKNNYGHLMLENQSTSSFLLNLVEKGADVLMKDYEGKRPHEYFYDDERRLLLSEYTRRSELLRESLLGEKVDLDCIKFSFIGDEMAGKTTLVYSLLEMDVPPFVQTTVQLELIFTTPSSQALEWDFGAQKTFHSAHGLLFRASNTVFTLVLRFREGKENNTTPEAELLRKGRFWLGFVKAACLVEMSSGKERRMKVVIVGNLIGAGDGKPEPNFMLKKVMDVLKEDFESAFEIAAVVEMDCSKQNSACMEQYRNILKKLRDQVIEMSSGVPKICRSVEEELQRQESVLKLPEEQRIGISRQFAEVPFYMTAENFSAWVKKEFEFSFEDGVVDVIADYLDLSGVIIRLGDRICLHSFWLCRNVIGPLLAPRYFPIDVPADNGQVKENDIKVALKSFKDDLKHRGLQKVIFDVTAQEAIEAFLHLELCYPIEGRPGEYQIPGLVRKQQPEDAWCKDDDMKVYRGLRYKCTHHKTDIISPSVFVTLQCRCSTMTESEVWNDGFVLTRTVEGDIAECLVNKRDDLSAIDLIVRSPSESRNAARELLKDVKDKLEKSCDEKSPGTALDWWYLDSKQLEKF
eukprot:m.275410 g.275410  ORF g.275410 m.275410 type:complete len:603 (+) comp40597_c0_seq81:1975-3783(+)